MSRRMSAGTEFMDIIDEGKERGREVRPAQQRGGVGIEGIEG